MKVIAKTCLLAALMFGVASTASAQWVRPDASVTFRAEFETQLELLEYLSAQLVKRQGFTALKREGEAPGKSPLIFRSAEGGDVVVEGVAQPGKLICVVVDYYYQRTLEPDIDKRDQELLASAERAAASLAMWLRSAGATVVEQKTPADMHSINEHGECQPAL
jgi:hypothetical protein